MAFVVRWLRDDEIVAERRFYDLEEAKRWAKDQFRRHRRSKGLTSAVLCDAAGKTLMQVF